MRLNNNIDFKKVSKIVCVGRNYAAHAQELNNPIPEQPLLFIKPNSTLAALEKPINIIHTSEVHFELELSILIDQPLTNPTEEQAFNAISGIGLALDLTLREIQSKLKQQGQPWERAKSFVGACPISNFISPKELALTQIQDLQQLEFSLHLNQQLQQHGRTQDMLFSIPKLIQEMAQAFSLNAGDIILTGTPSGVGKLQPKDTLECRLYSPHNPQPAIQIDTYIE